MTVRYVPVEAPHDVSNHLHLDEVLIFDPVLHQSGGGDKRIRAKLEINK